MIDPEDLVGPEWAQWYRMTPEQRWNASARLWADYLALGGSLDPEPDPQSPFFDPDDPVNWPQDRPQVNVGRLPGAST